MPGSGPRRTAEELEATYVQAYWHWRDGMTVREIAAEMSGTPHWCGGHSTLLGKEGWINRGRRIESERGGPLSKRQAQRERVAAAYNQMRVKVEAEMTAGLIPRIHGRRLQADLLLRYAQLLGLPMPAEVKVTGDVTEHIKLPRRFRSLVDDLAEVPRDELQLPDREEDNR